MQRRDLLGVLTSLALASPRALQAQPAATPGWPDRPLRLVVPYTPGGSTDIMARQVGEVLSQRLGQPVLIDNRAGAATNIGAEYVARAAPDGYTLLLTTSTMITNAALYRSLPFDVLRDFAPISQTAFVPNLLVTHPSLPVQDVAGLIALGKAQPGALNYGTAGSGSSQHLAAALFCARAGIEAVPVPYRGGAQVVLDLLAEKIQFAFSPLIEVLAHVQDRRLRPLGVSTVRSAAVLPAVPTIADTLPGYEVALWNGVFAPSATPPPIVARLGAEIVAIVASPAMARRIAAQGSEPVGSTPEQFASFVRAELPKWAELVRISGAQPE